MQIRQDLDPLRHRSAILLLLILLVLGALHVRLFELQVIHGSSWRKMAENNRLRRFPLPSSRGRIYDRKGNLLADNTPSWDLLVFPDEAHDLRETALFVAEIGVADVRSTLEELRSPRVGQLAPHVVGENLNWEQVTRVRAHQSEYPELSVVSGFQRVYPYGGAGAHAVGHLRLVRQKTLDQHPKMDPNTLVGATGTEAMANRVLTGTDGERWVMVSAIGKQLGVLRERQALPGEDIGITLDIDMQMAAAEALGDSAGSIVALDARTGAVRVLYSAPSFDPNIFVGRLSHSQWLELSQDPRHPLQNRSIQGTYPPGSTIKPFYSLGGLGEEEIPPWWRVQCLGSVTLYGHRFRCWQRGGHGTVGVKTSLEGSCDTFFYRLGQKLGIEGLARSLRHFGFGERTGVGLAAEKTGLIGTPEWSRRVRGTPWYPGEAVSVSIGQGPLLVTNLQLARAYAALANGGRLVTPHLAEFTAIPAPIDLGLDSAFLEAVNEGLRLVTQGNRGTARSLRMLSVAGKTGTAQVARLQEGVDAKDLPIHLRHHAWFVGWAPVEAPEIVVSVLVEHGVSGGGAAAPVAGKIFRAALRR